MTDAAPPADFTQSPRDAVAARLARFALAAGPAILEVYAAHSAARAKADGSPVTEADERAEAIIHARLAEYAPHVPVVAEEAVAAGGAIVAAREFFLVDPLDGTKEFVARNGEFTVNIGLVRDCWPVAGAVYAPALGKLWFGGESAFTVDVEAGADLPDASHWRQIRTRPAPASLTALASRSHANAETRAFLDRIPLGGVKSSGSSLKFCVVAEGEADVYPRFGPTMEWDTAAADAVLRAAGGVVLDRDGAPLRYGKFDLKLLNGAFVAWGDGAAAAKLNFEGARLPEGALKMTGL